MRWFGKQCETNEIAPSLFLATRRKRQNRENHKVLRSERQTQRNSLAKQVNWSDLQTTATTKRDLIISTGDSAIRVDNTSVNWLSLQAINWNNTCRRVDITVSLLSLCPRFPVHCWCAQGANFFCFHDLARFHNQQALARHSRVFSTPPDK